MPVLRRKGPRSRNSDTTSPPLSSGASAYDLYAPQVTVTYLLDPWGANRRPLESSQATAEAQRFQLEATYLADGTVAADANSAPVAMQAEIH